MPPNTALGHLLWVRVSATELKYHDVAKLSGLALPDPPIPIDVFRRITGPACKERYPLGDGSQVVFSTAKAPAQHATMVVRHIVATTRLKGVVKSVDRVGDAVFIKPPRGKPDKARLKVQAIAPSGAIWADQLAGFTKAMRQRYQAGVEGTLDTQAVRRMIRSFLSSIGALYLEGPYFVLDTEHVEPLKPLFALLGEAGWMFDVPLPDAPEYRALLTRGIEWARKQNVEPNPEIWARLEED